MNKCTDHLTPSCKDKEIVIRCLKATSYLAIGLTCSTLILLYLQHEFSYDRHHSKADRANPVEALRYE